MINDVNNDADERCGWMMQMDDDANG